MKKKSTLNLNWRHLSFVEYASGIEVFHAALFFKKEKKLQKKILDHALDEYRHSKYFYDLSKKREDRQQISTSIGLINIGGLSQSPFPAKKNKIIPICSYLYVGELRAIEFGKVVLLNYKDKEIQDVFNIIDKDEKNHATGLMSFLLKKNIFLVKYNIFINKLSFKFSDQKRFGLFSKLKTNAEKFLIKNVFRIFPESIFETKDNNNNFSEAYKNRKRLS